MTHAGVGTPLACLQKLTSGWEMEMDFCFEVTQVWLPPHGFRRPAQNLHQREFCYFPVFHFRLDDCRRSLIHLLHLSANALLQNLSEKAFPRREHRYHHHHQRRHCCYGSYLAMSLGRKQRGSPLS